MNISFRTFEPGDEIAFRELNEAWIERYFSIEAADRVVLNNPVDHVIAPGGQIVMAIDGGAPVGCCALLAMGDGVFEVAKMTIHEDYRGRGIGKRLLQAVVQTAVNMGAGALYLESNDRLADAIHLYQSVGFRHVPPDRVHASPYARSNVRMELDLRRSLSSSPQPDIQTPASTATELSSSGFATRT